MATAPHAAPATSERGLIAALNGRYHRIALWSFLVIVLGHWAEHVAQAFQIWGLGWARPKARGVLGMPFPWLVSSEWMHYGYAIIMLIGLAVLRPAFVGRARTWWTVALVIQFWHHIEHLLLLIQALFHHNFFGKAVPTSIAQLAFPRVELHLFYNAIVFAPMVVGMVLHLRPNRAERKVMTCACIQPALAGAAA